MNTNETGWKCANELPPPKLKSYPVQFADGYQATCIWNGKAWDAQMPVYRWFCFPPAPPMAKPSLADEIYAAYVEANGEQERGFVEMAIRHTLQYLSKMPVEEAKFMEWWISYCEIRRKTVAQLTDREFAQLAYSTGSKHTLERLSK